MDWTYPLIAFAALIVGALVGWVRGRRPLKLDVTIRQERVRLHRLPTDNEDNEGEDNDQQGS